jgi:hypothetical protein
MDKSASVNSYGMFHPDVKYHKKRTKRKNERKRGVSSASKNIHGMAN